MTSPHASPPWERASFASAARPGCSRPPLCRAAARPGAFQPLVNTYGTVPYADVNPSVLAGLAYVVMFGMMFGDVGQGLLLLGLGIAVWRATARQGGVAQPVPLGRTVRDRRGAGEHRLRVRLRRGFRPYRVGANALAPSARQRHDAARRVRRCRVCPPGMLVCARLDQPLPGGRPRPLAGGTVGVGRRKPLLRVWPSSVAGWYEHSATLALAGVALALAGLAFGFVGLFAEAGGRAGGALQAGIELFDSVIRLGTNTVSFARLAAFGLTHAALGALVWEGSVNLWRVGGLLGVVAGDRGVPGRERHHLLARSAGGRRAGPQARVLRDIFPRLHQRGPGVPPVAGSSPSMKEAP